MGHLPLVQQARRYERFRHQTEKEIVTCSTPMGNGGALQRKSNQQGYALGHSYTESSLLTRDENFVLRSIIST